MPGAVLRGNNTAPALVPPSLCTHCVRRSAHSEIAFRLATSTMVYLLPTSAHARWPARGFSGKNAPMWRLWWSFGRRFHNSDAVFVSYLLQKWPGFVIVCIGYCCSIIYLFSFIVWLIIVRVPAIRLWYVTQLVLFICCVVARPCVNISALVSAAYSPFGVSNWKFTILYNIIPYQHCRGQASWQRDTELR